MSREDENKAIVGRWFTKFWGETCDLGIVDELAAPDGSRWIIGTPIILTCTSWYAAAPMTAVIWSSAATTSAAGSEPVLKGASRWNLGRAASGKFVQRWIRKSRPSAGPGSTGCSVALRMMEPVWLISDQAPRIAIPNFAG